NAGPSGTRGAHRWPSSEWGRFPSPIVHRGAARWHRVESTGTDDDWIVFWRRGVEDSAPPGPPLLVQRPERRGLRPSHAADAEGRSGSGARSGPFGQPDGPLRPANDPRRGPAKDQRQQHYADGDRAAGTQDLGHEDKQPLKAAATDPTDLDRLTGGQLA